MPITTPRTIAELQQWYEEHHLPPQETTRFFIGVNYQRPRAFGIYQDGDRYVVYKNKNDGSRAIRYQGPDEAYAVRELWEKLKQEILRQKAAQPRGKSNKSSWLGLIILAGFLGILVFNVIFALMDLHNLSPKRGYYHYSTYTTIAQDFYYQGGTWYGYMPGAVGWAKVTPPNGLVEHWNDYYQGADYSSGQTSTNDYDYTDFSTTTYYSDYETSHSSGSSDSYSWDSSDSWDSGGMDFDSDW